MTTDPPDAPYGFADDPPPRPAPPPPAAEADAAADVPLTPAPEPAAEKPRRRRRRRFDEDEEGEIDADEPAVKERPDILEREDAPPPRPWWVTPAILAGVGAALCLVPVAAYTAREGVGAGLGVAGLTAAAVVVQVGTVAAFLMVAGSFFGIDYGPAHEAVAKLVAVTAVADGLTGAFGVAGSGCGLVVGLGLAGLVGAGLFQWLFRLSIHETLLTVSGIVAASWVLNGVVLAAVAHKYQKEAPPAVRPADALRSLDRTVSFG